jgi:predicted YcjX-like family ATPase
VQFKGAQLSSLAIAALRATTEETRTHNGRDLPMIRGRRLSDGKSIAFYPGHLPPEPAPILREARLGGAAWQELSLEPQAFAPAPLDLGPHQGLPHMRLDKAIEFLIGDKL